MKGICFSWHQIVGIFFFQYHFANCLTSTEYLTIQFQSDTINLEVAADPVS